MLFKDNRYTYNECTEFIKKDIVLTILNVAPSQSNCCISYAQVSEASTGKYLGWISLDSKNISFNNIFDF